MDKSEGYNARAKLSMLIRFKTSLQDVITIHGISKNTLNELNGLVKKMEGFIQKILDDTDTILM